MNLKFQIKAQENYDLGSHLWIFAKVMIPEGFLILLVVYFKWSYLLPPIQ